MLLGALLPFAASREWPLVHDDRVLLGPGSLVADPRADVPLLLRADLFGSVDRPWGESGYWRPVALSLYAFSHWITSGDPAALPWVAHVLLLALHALATWGLARLLVALGWHPLPACGAALLFGVHPVQAESAAWISSLCYTGATACGLWGAVLLVERRGPAAALGAGALFLLALGFKESGALPVLLGGAVAWLAGRDPRRSLGVPLAALASYAALRGLAFHEGVSTGAWTGPPDAATRWLTWLSIVPDVVRLSLWPSQASPLRPVPAADALLAPGVVAGALVLLVLAGLALQAVRRRSAGGLLAAGTLLGTAGFLAPWAPLGLGFPETNAPLFERHMYLAAAAAPVALGLALRGWRERAPRAALGACLLLALPLGAVAAGRARAWSSDEAFARAGLALAPQAGSLWNHLGVARLEDFRGTGDGAAGREALAAFERARELDPDALLPELNRFIALASLGRRADAEEAAGGLLRRHPDEAAVLDNLAYWHLGDGRARQAAELFERELRLPRPLPGAAPGLAQALEALERAAGADAGAREPPGAAGAEGGT